MFFKLINLIIKKNIISTKVSEPELEMFGVGGDDNQIKLSHKKKNVNLVCQEKEKN